MVTIVQGAKSSVFHFIVYTSYALSVVWLGMAALMHLVFLNSMRCVRTVKCMHNVIMCPSSTGVCA